MPQHLGRTLDMDRAPDVKTLRHRQWAVADPLLAAPAKVAAAYHPFPGHY
ncbi:MAG: hypothetical protein HKL89_00265 [Candidatus Dormibacteraeota bacterium]|nr:hypothetical protein [Candidatus Dormibacteraeota bacterium]